MARKKSTREVSGEDGLGVRESTGNSRELPVTAGTSRELNKKEGLSFIEKAKLKLSPTKSYLIKMFFSNGTCKEFVIVTKSETFTYNKRTYYLRYEDAWFNLTQNQFELCYFDDYPVPIDRAIQKLGEKEYFSVTPENLKPLIKMNYVKVLAQSDFDQKLNTMIVFMVVLCILNAAMIFFTYRLTKMLGGVIG